MDMALHPTVHTDCPVMSPDPLTSIWTAVTRKAKSGAVIGQTCLLYTSSKVHLEKCFRGRR